MTQLLALIALIIPLAVVLFLFLCFLSVKFPLLCLSLPVHFGELKNTPKE